MNERTKRGGGGGGGGGGADSAHRDAALTHGAFSAKLRRGKRSIATATHGSRKCRLCIFSFAARGFARLAHAIDPFSYRLARRGCFLSSLLIFCSSAHVLRIIKFEM